MGNFIHGLPKNREESLVRPTHELTEDIAALFLVFFAATRTGVKQDGINDPKENDDDDAVMADINESESVSCEDKESMYNRLTDKGVEDLEEAWRKEWS